MFRTRVSWLAALALVAVTASARGQSAVPAVSSDRAVFEIKVHDRTVGTETILIERDPDSLRVESSSRQFLGATGSDSLIKRTQLVASAEDYELRAYASAQRFLGQLVERGVQCEDTVIRVSSFAQGRGEQDVYSRPPGRLFVIDAGSFVSFDLICRMLRGKPFVTRPVNMMILGPRDTVVTATLEDRGTETLRWGTGPVTARRVVMIDRSSEYVMWMDSEGRMLRLENAWSGVRVERQPPPARTAPRKPKPSS